MAFVDFFCNASTGSNLNGGSDAGSVTYTSTNGNWSTATNIFTPTDGTNPVSAGVVAGQYASIYVDGATVAVYIAKVLTVVNAANGAITVSASLVAGSAPSTSATGRSIKVGGAWKGPNAADGFPVTLATVTLLAAGTDKFCLNLKNNATYSITANVAETGISKGTIQGYTTTARDGGKAIIDGGTSGTSFVLLTTSAAAAWSHVDLIFQNNGATGTAAGVTATANTYVSFIRCVFSAMRGSGVTANIGAMFIECEAFGNNLSNTASLGGFAGSGDFMRCISHDNTGSNSAGFFLSTTNAISSYTSCIADTNGGAGFNVSLSAGVARLSNCDAYNNASDGIRTTSSGGTFFVENCNLIKNGGWGINFVTSTVSTNFIYNCGFGSGSQINSSGTTTGTLTGQETGSITYAANVTPWADPANGDFRITLAAARSTGRGAFTETAPSYAGSVGFPDIGAVQSLCSNLGMGGLFALLPMLMFSLHA